MATKTELLRVRMSPEHLELIKTAAGAAGLSVSAWATERLLSAAHGHTQPMVPPFGPEASGKSMLVPMALAAARSPEVPEQRTTVRECPEAPQAWGPPAAETPKIAAEHEALVFKTLGSNCLDCGDEGQVRKVNEDGPATPRNLQVLCYACDCSNGGRDYRDHAEAAELITGDPID